DAWQQQDTDDAVEDSPHQMAIGGLTDALGANALTRADGHIRTRLETIDRCIQRVEWCGESGVHEPDVVGRCGAQARDDSMRLAAVRQLEQPEALEAIDVPSDDLQRIVDAAVVSDDDLGVERRLVEVVTEELERAPDALRFVVYRDDNRHGRQVFALGYRFVVRIQRTLAPARSASTRDDVYRAPRRVRRSGESHEGSALSLPFVHLMPQRGCRAGGARCRLRAQGVLQGPDHERGARVVARQGGPEALGAGVDQEQRVAQREAW